MAGLAAARADVRHLRVAPPEAEEAERPGEPEAEARVALERPRQPAVRPGPARGQRPDAVAPDAELVPLPPAPANAGPAVHSIHLSGRLHVFAEHWT